MLSAGMMGSTTQLRREDLDMQDDDNIYRINWVSRIKNKWLRRVLLIVMFPFLFTINCTIATVSAVIFVLVFWWKNNVALFQATSLRWNVRKED